MPKKSLDAPAEFWTEAEAATQRMYGESFKSWITRKTRDMVAQDRVERDTTTVQESAQVHKDAVAEINIT
jgi:hypothetical protein